MRRKNCRNNTYLLELLVIRICERGEAKLAILFEKNHQIEEGIIMGHVKCYERVSQEESQERHLKVSIVL